MAKKFEFTITAVQKGARLDHWLSLQVDLALSRSQAKKLIASGGVTVNKQLAEPSYKLKLGDRLEITLPTPPDSTVKPENIPLDIIYEDNDIVVVNKPRGLVVHPAPGNPSGTLVNALLYHCNHLATVGAPLRPGIVQRLDKDTSGLIVVAKTNTAYYSLVKQLKNRSVEKTYLALVQGVIKNDGGVIEARIGRHPVQRKKMAVISRENQKSRTALTYYRVLKRYDKYTLVEVKIKTGRTHQIRVHFSHLGYPLVGDKTYGKGKNEWGVVGQLLHAQKLSFIHPNTNQQVTFEAQAPREFQTVT